MDSIVTELSCAINVTHRKEMRREFCVEVFWQEIEEHHTRIYHWMVKNISLGMLPHWIYQVSGLQISKLCFLSNLRFSFKLGASSYRFALVFCQNLSFFVLCILLCFNLILFGLFWDQRDVDHEIWCLMENSNKFCLRILLQLNYLVTLMSPIEKKCEESFVIKFFNRE